MSTIRRCCLAFAVLLVIGVDVCLTRQSRGQVFTYTGPNNGSWQTAAFWAPFAPPFFVPPPSVGDAAIINVNRDVLLNGNVFIADLSLSNGGDLLTNGFLLDVGNVAGTAEADVIGTGSTGNNTELFVQPFNGVGIDYSLNVDVLNLENGGELDLVNDATAQITRRLNVDALSIITGQGTIRFTDEHNVAGRRFDLRGTLRPDGNQTITLVAESGTIDLDGLVHNDNWVDLTNLGSRLVVDGPLTDSFTGRIDLGNDSTLTLLDPWIFGPQPGNVSLATLNIQPGSGNTATIAGAPMTIGGGGATAAPVNVQSGNGRITADAIIQSNADINVFAGARIDFDGDVTYTGSASISGLGTLDVGATNSVIGNVTIATSTVDFDQGSWDISRQLTLDTETIDAAPGNTFNSHTINIYSQALGSTGRLTVNLPGSDSWTLASNANLNITAPNGNLAAINLAGSKLRVVGLVNIDGNSRFSAPIDVLTAGAIQLADASSSLTLINDSQLSGGSVAGSGRLRSSGAVVSGHGLIATDVDFSGTSELWADNGTLRITGDLNNLGAAIGTADDDGVLLLDNNDSWDTAMVGEVRLHGGALIDGASSSFIQNTAGGQIRGHGTINVESVNNYGTIAAEGGQLEIVDRLDWDGSSTGLLGNEGDGTLAARQGNLLISHAMHQGPSFVGTIATASRFAFTYDTGGSNDQILFDDATGDSDSGGDFGTLLMTGGRLITDIVRHEGQFTIRQAPSTIVADQVIFDALGNTTIDSVLRLDTSDGIASVIDAGATFSGSGSLVNTLGSALFVDDEAEIGVDLVNDGTLHVGAGLLLSSIAADMEARSLEQTKTGALIIDLEGTGLDQFDRIDAANSASLDGALTVGLLFGFSPLAGDSFEIITAGAAGVSGAFATLNSPALSGDLFLDILYNPNNVVLQVVTPYSADFDKDGDVDADDLAQWEGDYGGLGSDADGDGDSDAADFLAWQGQFGSGVGAMKLDALQAVPEPGGLCLVCCSLAAIACLRLPARE